MRTKLVINVIMIFLAFTLIMGQENENEKMSSAALAEKLVSQCANIQEGDIVLINGGVRDVELLEDMAIQVSKLGAFRLVTLSSDRLNRLYFDKVPARYDTRVPELGIKLAAMVTAQIDVDFNESIGLYADVPPERFAALTKTYAPINNLYLKRNVRWVSLGNGLYPTKDRAKLFNIPEQELAKIFWAGVNVDYVKLKSKGETIQEILNAGKDLQITNKNGTNLTLQIEGRPSFLSDGVISEEDIEIGGAACQVWLPAGEVYLAPVSGTANGLAVVDRLFYQGKEIKNLKLTFKNGKLTSMKAESGLDAFKARYDASGTGKDVFGFIDVGLNPNVKIPKDSKMAAWMASGMITIGVGNNNWAGGENETDFDSAFFLPGSTLKIDGKVLVENGVLK